MRKLASLILKASCATSKHYVNAYCIAEIFAGLKLVIGRQIFNRRNVNKCYFPVHNQKVLVYM